MLNTLIFAKTVAFHCHYLVTLDEPLGFSGPTSIFINEGIDLNHVSDFSGPLHSLWQRFPFWIEGGWGLRSLGIHYISIRWHRVYAWAWSCWALTGKYLILGPQLKHVYTWLIAWNLRSTSHPPDTVLTLLGSEAGIYRSPSGERFAYLPVLEFTAMRHLRAGIFGFVC